MNTSPRDGVDGNGAAGGVPAAPGPRGGKQLHLKYAPPLSTEMRATLMSLRDEAYNDGKTEGRREVEQEYYGNGIISWGVGTLCGMGFLFALQRVFA